MQQNFIKCLSLVLEHEGGYVNHPKDPGGATNKGVTQAVYDAWRTSLNLDKRSVRNITGREMELIYRRQYWDRVEGDDLPAGIDYAVFDYAVNSGTGRAEKEIQRVVGVTADGQIGVVTLAAINAGDPATIINGLCNRRMAFLRALKTWPTFGRGWTKRVSGVRAVALEMASVARPQPDDPGPDPKPAEHWLMALVKAVLGWLKLGGRP